MRGEVPNVRCTGDLRDFIMKVRTQPLEVGIVLLSSYFLLDFLA